jgi:hypothetical protein
LLSAGRAFDLPFAIAKDLSAIFWTPGVKINGKLPDAAAVVADAVVEYASAH